MHIHFAIQTVVDLANRTSQVRVVSYKRKPAIRSWTPTHIACCINSQTNRHLLPLVKLLAGQNLFQISLLKGSLAQLTAVFVAWIRTSDFDSAIVDLSVKVSAQAFFVENTLARLENIVLFVQEVFIANNTSVVLTIFLQSLLLLLNLLVLNLLS